MDDPIVHCEHCGKKFRQSQQYAHWGGFYCSEKCYDTLFLNCISCGQLNMTAKTNLDQHGEQLCEKCYDAKHGLVSVTIIQSIHQRYS